MNPSAKIRLLLVDDHFMIRVGLRGSLDQESDMVVVAEAENAGEAWEKYRAERPDVVLMDGRLPDQHGVEATRRLREEFPDARVILVSVDEGEEDIHRAVEAGVQGYLPKSVAREELLLAIRRIHQGGRYFPPAVAARIAARKKREPLSDREVGVLRLVMKGFANKQIAEELKITEATVKAHVSNILDKMDAPDRTRAVTVAIERGIMRLE
ncbi:MAG TPA: response regulator transcription factor [Chthoniobacteraceae bacterium]|jgi:DNA-binding NarL/FixJ family response regulator